MTQASIQLKMTPGDFDLMRATLTECRDGYLEIANDIGESAASSATRSNARRKAVEVSDLLNRLNG